MRDTDGCRLGFVTLTGSEAVPSVEQRDVCRDARLQRYTLSNSKLFLSSCAGLVLELLTGCGRPSVIFR